MKLSKREIILLTFLIIVALIFLEYTIIIAPGITRGMDLSNQNLEMENKINAINLDLTLAKSMEEKRDEDLAVIDDLATPFLNGISTDSLLVFTHEMLIKHGFTLFAYSPSELVAEGLQPEQIEISQLTYRIKEIANSYRQIEAGSTIPDTTPDGTDVTNPTDVAQPDDSVERYTLQISAAGSYDQIKALFDDFTSLRRTAYINNISMTPDPVTVGLLSVDFQINYYGIEKLTADVDPMNKWTRESIPANINDPFDVGITTPSETTTTTTGG